MFPIDIFINRVLLYLYLNYLGKATHLEKYSDVAKSEYGQRQDKVDHGAVGEEYLPVPGLLVSERVLTHVELLLLVVAHVEHEDHRYGAQESETPANASHSQHLGTFKARMCCCRDK